MKWVSKAPLPTVGEPGEVRLVPETAEDLWHTYNMLAIGDALSANTIRKVAKELQAKGEKVRPVTIVEILKKRGIKIAPPQASMVLGKMGFKRKKRRKSGATAGAAGPVVKKASKSTLSIEDLLKAKKMAEEFGGAEKLVNAISALVELQ